MYLQQEEHSYKILFLKVICILVTRCHVSASEPTVLRFLVPINQMTQYKMTIWSRSHDKNGCHALIRSKLKKTSPVPKAHRPWVPVCGIVNVVSTMYVRLAIQG